MTELKSLLDELQTLLAVGDRVGIKLPPEVTDAINKVLAAMGSLDVSSGKTVSLADLLADVEAIITDVEKAIADPELKQFAGQVLTLIDNIRAAAKPSYAPASVVIKDVPAS